MNGTKTPSARGFFDRADQFHYTALYLHQHPKDVQFIYAVPNIVLKSFATEAYLKSLLILEEKSPRPIHNFLALFDALSAESRRQIKEAWDKTSRSKLLELKRSAPPEDLRVQTSLRAALE